MARRRTNSPNNDEPSEADLEQFGGVTRTCPECKTEVYDEAELCWHCGHVFSATPRPTRGPWVVTAIVILLVIVLTLTQIL